MSPTRTSNRCAAHHRLPHFVQQRASPAPNDLCLKALPDHSFMCRPVPSPQNAPHSQDLVIIGSVAKHRRQWSQSGYISAVSDPGDEVQHTTHQLQQNIASTPSPPPLPHTPLPPPLNPQPPTVVMKANGCQHKHQWRFPCLGPGFCCCQEKRRIRGREWARLRGRLRSPRVK